MYCVQVTDEAVMGTLKRALSELEGQDSGVATIDFLLEAASICLNKYDCSTNSASKSFSTSFVNVKYTVYMCNVQHTCTCTLVCTCTMYIVQ